MKTTALRKKLSLNKTTIINLSDAEKRSVYGGLITDPPATCADSITCCTWWQTCESRFNSNCI
jgi:hypothetical protein